MRVQSFVICLAFQQHPLVWSHGTLEYRELLVLILHHLGATSNLNLTAPNPFRCRCDSDDQGNGRSILAGRISRASFVNASTMIQGMREELDVEA